MGFAGQVTGFVQAFSPATVELFQLAVRDLTAVIGSALQPVLAAMTGVVRQVSASLLPVAEAMAPVFETLSGVMLKVLTPALDTLASVVQSMVPVFEVLAGVVDALTPLLRIGQTLIAGWVQLLTDMITALLPGKEGVKGFVEQFAEAMRELSAAVMKVVATVAKFFGATSFIDGMVKSLTGKMSEKKDATGMGAPTGAAFTSVTDFGKQVATRAFMATGEPEKSKTTEQWLATLSEDLKGIKEGTNTAMRDAIVAGVEPVARPVREMLAEVKEIAKKISGGVYEAASAARGAAFGFGDRITFGGLSALNSLLGDAK
jgi:phage-related protein